MKPPIQKTVIVVCVISLLAIVTCFARIVPLWPYEKLVAEADVVAIVEPVENKPAQDTFPGYSYGHPSNHFTATDTRFKIQAVLKGDAMKELTVLHFSYSNSTNVSIIINGASFIQFKEKQECIAFLKRRSDGRFESVTGHYDSAYSFRELHRASYYAKP
jgi:hypothetical protein